MIVAFYNLRKPAVRKVLGDLKRFCAKKNIKFYSIDGRKISLDRPGRKPIWTSQHSPRVAVTLGGDGTLLTAARHLVDFDIPVLGINLGGMGFLAAADKSNWATVLNLALEGKVVPRERLVLSVVVERLGKKYSYLVINDCAIRVGRSPRMLEMDITLDPQASPIRLKSDGLVLSTPTGSTAYALSVGGPIVEPRADAYLMVPLAPHSLTQRPLVLDSNRTVSLRLSSYHGEKTKAMVFLDGQLSDEIKTGDTVTVSRYHKPLLLLREPKHNYFDLLKEKFGWAV